MEKLDIKTNFSKNNIFLEHLSVPTIFKDKKVLSSSFIPDQILHREQEIESLTKTLAPSLRGYQPNNIFIYGTVGTGKTITIKFILNQLKEIDKGKIKTIYINCKMKKVADTEYRLFAQLLKEYGVIVPDTGLPTDVLYRKFFESLEKEGKIVIIVLDEIDALVSKVGDEFLYNLTRMNSELKKSQITLIGITNNLSFRDNLDVRVKSSLGEEEILFRPYNALQLKDILKKRIEFGFNYGVVDEGVLNKCAALAAQEHGDARRALDLIRVAAEIAERNGDVKVTEKHANIAEQKLDMDRVIETVKSQPKQSQAVLLSIINCICNGSTWCTNTKSALTGDVLEFYQKICAKNNINVLTQRRISDLISELDMLGIITSKIISKGRYGRSREITLAMNDDVLNKVRTLLQERFES